MRRTISAGMGGRKMWPPSRKIKIQCTENYNEDHRVPRARPVTSDRPRGSRKRRLRSRSLERFSQRPGLEVFLTPGRP